MRFVGLFENERYWQGASEFYKALGKIGIDYRLYELPAPEFQNPDAPSHYVMSGDEAEYYVASILNDLRGKPHSEYLEYVKQRCLALKRWAEKGYIIHIKP